MFTPGYAGFGAFLCQELNWMASGHLESNGGLPRVAGGVMAMRRQSGLPLLTNKERGHSYRRPLLCQPFRTVKNVAGLHAGHLRGVHAFPLFHWGDMPLDVLLHTGNCPALDAPPTRGGARGPRGGLPPTEARGVIRADMHIAKPPQWPFWPTPFPVPIGAIRFWEATVQRSESHLMPNSGRGRAKDSVLAKVLWKPWSSVSSVRNYSFESNFLRAVHRATWAVCNLLKRGLFGLSPYSLNIYSVCHIYIISYFINTSCIYVTYNI